MREINHTPTPWVFDPTLPTGVYSDDATGSRIATTGRNNLVLRDPKEDEANAAFIVTSVNAYDKHLALIETMSAELDQLRQTGAYSRGHLDGWAAGEKALGDRVKAISEDFIPDRDGDAPLALQEMRDALTAALVAAKEMSA